MIEAFRLSGIALISKDYRNPTSSASYEARKFFEFHEIILFSVSPTDHPFGLDDSVPADKLKAS